MAADFIKSLPKVWLAAGLAVALAPAAVALPEDADQPIHIRADRAEVDQNAETVTYRGSVVVDQGTMHVTADEMIVEYSDQKVVRITAHGTPAEYSQQLEGERGRVEADAATIVYHTRDEQVDLKGDAFLSQGGNEMTGELIHYDIVAGRVNAEAREGGAVQVTVQPASRQNAPPPPAQAPAPEDDAPAGEDAPVDAGRESADRQE